MLFRRVPEEGGAFFLDAFEATSGDLAQWYQSTGTEPAAALRRLWDGREPLPEEAVLPAPQLDLQTARGFCRWRLGRLPRLDEWIHAASGGGRYNFPWGDRPVPTWANGGALGLGRRAPVGAFESGRQGGGPYDLLGNLAEWTETVPEAWFRWDSSGLFTAPAAAQRWIGQCGSALARVYPLRVPGQPLPAVHLIQWGAESVPRWRVGGSFLEPLPQDASRVTAWDPDTSQALPLDAGATTGCRLAVGPVGLLLAMLRRSDSAGAVEREVWQSFLNQAGHRQELARAWPVALQRWRDHHGGTSPAAGSIGELVWREFVR